MYNKNNIYYHYINDNTVFYYKNNKNITCTIQSIEYNSFLMTNPKVTLLITYQDYKQSFLITTKKDFERLWIKTI